MLGCLLWSFSYAAAVMSAFPRLAFIFLKLNYKETAHLRALDTAYYRSSCLHGWMAIRFSACTCVPQYIYLQIWWCVRARWLLGAEKERLRDSCWFLICVYQCSPAKEASIYDCFVFKSSRAALFIQRSATQSVNLQVQIANYLLSCSMRTTLQRMTSVCSNAGVVCLDNSTSRCLPMTCSCSTSLCTLFLVSLRCYSNTQPVGCRQSKTHTLTHRHTPPVGWDEKRHFWYFPKDLFSSF